DGALAAAASQADRRGQGQPCLGCLVAMTFAAAALQNVLHIAGHQTRRRALRQRGGQADQQEQESERLHQEGPSRKHLWILLGASGAVKETPARRAFGLWALLHAGIMHPVLVT